MNAATFLAQIPQSLYSTGNTSPGEMTALYIIIGIVVVGIIAALIYNGSRAGPGGSSISKSGPSYSRGGFKRAARAAGLGDDEIRFLDPYARAIGLSNPEFAFRNQAKLDTFFKDVFRYIEKNSASEAEADELKSHLFSSRELLTRLASQGSPITSTRQLGRNMPLTFIAPGEESYPSVIIAVEPGGLAVEPVRDPYGEPIKFRKGAKITCYFYSATHKGYQFMTRSVGWERIGTKEAMVLAHSDAVSALPSRNHARREMQAPCTFYRVNVTVSKQRGKEHSSAKVENLPLPGTIVDVSAGGLGIQTANPLPAGDFLKIEFNPGTGSQAAFCKVIRTNKVKHGGVMHLQFVKISRRTLNAVLSFVYGYAD